ncbi:post-GPI attachment to proteins factor 6 isoform X4 [Ovis aries]|uniref:post-GPI attachment to proteins factor 6 isoform X4 n=1 Tax=Ovis aries TaxID=9940 RepID=UPI00295265BE|nr:post-GPI attachment to proteins factor 6 isoform X4 [Ovis aries]
MEPVLSVSSFTSTSVSTGPHFQYISVLPPIPSGAAHSAATEGIWAQAATHASSCFRDHLCRENAQQWQDSRLVSEQFSQAPQKLAFYNWYGSARLFHFRVPPDTVLLRWLLQVTRGSGPACSNVETTVYFRYGAPPVINPLGTSFANNTSVQPSFLLKMLQDNASFNVSYPAPGDWFVAAHLPPSSHKIEVKDFIPTCAYIFQPDMLVVRVVEMSILKPDVPLPLVLLSQPSYLKVFVPKHTQELRLELQGCVSNGSLGCPVHLTVGSATLPGNFQKVLTCSDPTTACRLLLPSPPWERWMQVTAKSLAGPRASVTFSAVVALTACRPWTVNLQHLLNSSDQSSNTSTGTPLPSPNTHDLDQSGKAGSGPFCFRSFPILREDMDVVSVRFRPLDGVSVLVQSDMPSVMQLYLNTGMDSGGSLSISVSINQTVIANSTSVVACVTAGSPFLSFNTSLNCTTAFFQGYPLSLSASSPTANLSIPYPETDNWYLSLQVLCPERPELAWVELHRQQHGPDSGPAESSHPPAHPEQPPVPGPYRHLRAPLPSGGGLSLCLHHVLLHVLPRLRSAGRRCALHPQLRHAAVLRLSGLRSVHLGHCPLHGPAEGVPEIRPLYPGHSDLRHVLAAGPQGRLEHDGALPLCHRGHGYHVGVPLRPPAPLLPPLLAALGLLPPARPLHGCSGPHHLCFHDDQRKLLLHPQHLAHAAGRERSLLAAAKGPARRALGLCPEAQLPL